MRHGIVVNARFLHRKITGVERYAGEILDRLEDRVRWIYPGLRLTGMGGHVWEQLILPGQIDEDEILWSPANTGPLALDNQVITIHDLSFVDHPEWYHPAFAAWYNFLIPRLVHRVRLITTVSSYIKIRMMDKFRIYETQVEVIPGGVDTQKFRRVPATEVERIRQKYNFPYPYILVLGSIHPRKNLVNVFAAWREVYRLHPDTRLLVVGSRSDLFSVPATNEIPPGILLAGYIDDADLPALYCGAAAYLLASLYEGFGLTVLEAMACGTPVIAANITAIPEVVGGAGWLFNPFDVDELAHAVIEVISDESLSKNLVQKGYQRVDLFTWERSARMLYDFLERELIA
jgi:glycosyltransferase involved in cell wall biosynthesis